VFPDAPGIGATYEGAGSRKPLTPEIGDGLASVAVELEPKGAGCVSAMQKLP